MIRNTDMLDELPTFAVVKSHNSQVYQKLPIPVGGGWFKPGSAIEYWGREIALPARLLDDGL